MNLTAIALLVTGLMTLCALGRETNALSRLHSMDEAALSEEIRLGNADAMHIDAVRAAMRYYGREFSTNELVRRFERAATAGSAESKAWMTLVGLRGITGITDESVALAKARESADGGSKDGLWILSQLYTHGIGEPRSVAEQPEALVDKLVAAAYPDALLVKASDLIQGRQARRDVVSGASLLEKAARAGHLLAGQAYWQAWNVATNSTVAPHEALQRYVWMIHRSRIDDQSALLMLGNLFLDGEMTPPNPEKAVDYFRKAARKGNIRALERLGFCAEQGLGVAKDPAEAKRLYSRAGESVAEAVAALRRLSKLQKD